MNTISINKKTTSLRLAEDLYERIQALAKQENRSVNNYIETILFDAVGYEPNATTKTAMQEAKEIMNDKSRKGITDASSLLKSLDEE